MHKRAHHKSRFGCTRCKARRVKCDEAQPQCTACVRHRVACVYPRQEEPLTATAQASTLSQSPPVHNLDRHGADSPASSSPYAANTPSATNPSHWELRLFHFFMTHTSETLSPAYSLWKSRLPLIAFDQPAVYQLLMALTTLHLGRVKRHPGSVTQNVWGYTPTLGTFFEQQDIGELQAISKEYFERGVRRHQSAIGQLTTHEEYEGAFVGSVLVSMYSLFMLGDSLNSTSEDPDSTAHPPEKVWFELAMGPREIGTIWASFAGQNVMKLWGITYEEPNLVDDPELINKANATPLKLLFDTGRDFEVVSEGDDDAYEEALIYVGLMYRRARDRDESPQATCRRIIAMPSKLSPRFRQLVVEGRHRALAVLAFVFATGRVVEHDILLLRGVARARIPDIYRRLPAAWKKLLAWPMDMLDAEVSSYPELYFRQ